MMSTGGKGKLLQVLPRLDLVYMTTGLFSIAHT